jgi:hypothetical protein
MTAFKVRQDHPAHRELGRKLDASQRIPTSLNGPPGGLQGLEVLTRRARPQGSLQTKAQFLQGIQQALPLLSSAGSAQAIDNGLLGVPAGGVIGIRGR